MFDHINREYIRSHQFKSDGLFMERERTSTRISPDAVLPESPEKKQIQLRKRLNSLIHEKLDGSSGRIEAACGVSYELVRKYMAGRRNVTRDTLAKLCVGMALSVEEAQQLFQLQGHSLEPDINRLDAILVDVLKCGEDIHVFYEECEEFGLPIFR